MHRMFSVRAPRWYFWLNPRWRENRAALEAWLHENQMDILLQYQTKRLAEHTTYPAEKAAMNAKFGRSPLGLD